MIAAATVCGRISPAPLGSMIDRTVLEKMRLKTDAGLMGAGTLRSDNPEMRGPGGIHLEKRIRAIISGSGRVTKDRNLFANGPKPFIFTSLECEARVSAEFGALAHVVGLPAGRHGLSIASLLTELAERGARSVLIEGGGTLNYSCLAEGVVDEIALTLCPFISGDRNGKSVIEGPEPLGSSLLPLELISYEGAGTGEIFIKYRVRRG